MNNITAQDIVEAYKKTGIRPISGNWGGLLNKGNGLERCGCGITALMASKQRTSVCEDDTEFKHFVFNFTFDSVATVMKYVEREYPHVSEDFVRGFMSGFDGSSHSGYEDEWTDGYRVGKEARDLLFEKPEGALAWKRTEGIPKPEFLGGLHND